MNTEKQLGQKIKELRKANGLTQEQLAEYAHIDNKHLSKIENGIHLPTYNTLRKISEVLKFNFHDINSKITDNNILNNNRIYAKSLKILNSAKNDKELLHFYNVLKLTKRIIQDK